MPHEGIPYVTIAVFISVVQSIKSGGRICDSRDTRHWQHRMDENQNNKRGSICGTPPVLCHRSRYPVHILGYTSTTTPRIQSRKKHVHACSHSTNLNHDQVAHDMGRPRIVTVDHRQRYLSSTLRPSTSSLTSTTSTDTWCPGRAPLKGRSVFMPEAGARPLPKDAVQIYSGSMWILHKHRTTTHSR